MTVDSARTPFTALAETYERVAVPAMLAPEALNLLEFAALQPGERVLDVACGTGIVARLAAPRLGPRGQIVGLDLNAAMLAVARTRPVPLGARFPSPMRRSTRCCARMACSLWAISARRCGRCGACCDPSGGWC